MARHFLLLLAAITAAVFCAGCAPRKPATFAGLVVFHQPGVSELARRFETEHLPAILELARAAGVETRVIDARAGAPGEVALTPLLVFQNERGRSFYQGRYADIGRVRHFLQTARSVAQADTRIERRDALVRRDGRLVVAGAIKITELGGAVPPGFDGELFRREGRDAIARGADNFELPGSVSLRRTDRTYYFDFYPWLEPDGTFYLFPALYSPFNCHEPIHRDFDNPISGPWTGRVEVFARAGSYLASTFDELMRTSGLGDGFDAIPSSVSGGTWEDFGLALPEPPPGEKHFVPADPTPAARDWIADPAAFDAQPPIEFYFEPPLDSYAGLVPEAHAELHLAESGRLEGATGFVQADAAQVTMGEPDLDSALRTTTLETQAHPHARFDLATVDFAQGPLAFGDTTVMQARGRFTLKGVAIDIPVLAEIAPFIDISGGVPQTGDELRASERLAVTASFTINLDAPFGIAGPDGPAPANDTLHFRVHLTMRPAKP